VTNSWAQYHQGALKSGNDPNDTIFTRHLAIANDYLTRSWSFTTGAALSGSAAVVDGVAYVGNRSGTVDAIGVQTGLQDWSTQLPAGTAIDTTPAVTPTGVVVVGSTNGSVYGLSASTGTLLWATTLGTSAIESSPSVSGSVVYVGTDSGHLVALQGATGRKMWVAVLSGKITSSPAVDSIANLVIVGSSDHTVRAVALKTGKLTWTYKTGGAVAGSPLVTGSRVFIGSADGNAYALSESSGAKLWSVPTGGSITASASLMSGLIVFGSGSGKEYYLKAPNGSATYVIPFKSPIVGLSSAGDFTVAELANGQVIGSKPANTSNETWVTTFGTSLASTPVVINGEVILTGLNGIVACETVPGLSPV
jgi:outer membrane protein assembly factor BamB